MSTRRSAAGVLEIRHNRRAIKRQPMSRVTFITRKVIKSQRENSRMVRKNSPAQSNAECLLHRYTPEGAIPTGAWAALSFMIVMTTAVAYVCYYLSLRSLPASQTAAYAYLQPVTATTLSITLGFESLTLYLGLGVLAVLGGVALAQRN